ncbi:MAG TPA: CHAT domain-containing tetratricopeptide repeat protein [Blastocatellia bacterium]|nr:CHAT domain-containing tetratricopeptide repeat protein [Blastocatellia bacterium]
MRFAGIHHLVLSLLVGITSATFAQTPAEIIPLEEGKPLLRDLAVGQEHNYQINLQAGQCARIEVEQHGINVLLTTFAPNNNYLFGFDREWGTTGIERLILVAETSGAYQVRIEPQGPPNAKNIPPGKYVIKLAVLHPATEQEQRAFQAHILFAWAKQRGYSTDEKVKAEGIQQTQEWLRLYRNDGDTDAIYEMLRLLGAHATAQRNFTQSADYHQQMIAMLQATGEQRRLGYILQDISFQYHLVREYQTAVNYKLQELAIWQRLEDRNLQGWAWNMLGLQYLRLRQIEKSLEAHAQRLAIVRELKDSTQEADTLQTIASVYGWMEESTKSLDYVMQALRVAEKAGAKRTQASILAELPDRIAFNEGSLSAMQVMRTDPVRRQEFLAMYEKSRALFRELNDPFEAEPLSMLAIWQAHNGQREAALASAERALQLSQAMPQLPRNGLKSTIANVYSVLGDFDKAIALQEEAVRNFNGDFDGSANLLRGLANLLIKAGRLIEARARIEEAIRIKESLRRRLSEQEYRTNVSTDLARAYSFYADLLMQIYRQKPEALLLEEAFTATERARARSLLDLLIEARANIRSDVDPALLARETTLQQKLNSLTPHPNDPRKEQLLAANQHSLNDTLDELRQVRAQIRQSNPRFAELTEPQPPTVREIQTQLLDADTMLLSYALGEQRSFVWAITTDAIQAYELPSREEITKLTRRVYELLTTPQRLTKLSPAQQQKHLQEAAQQYQTEAAALSQMLLAPVASQLGTKRLLIIAPEALQYLPFGALPKPVVGRQLSVVGGTGISNRQPTTGNGQPLITDHEIINLPSVSVMMLLRNETAQRNPAPKAVAVLADPVFDAHDSRVKAKAKVTATSSASSALARSLRSFDVREGLARLMLSRNEAEAITVTVPENARLKALDFKASRAEAMNAALSQYRIVHFATHGLLNAERPELSGLVFSLVDEKGNAQDGFLRLHEIYNLKLPAELVVLSACQTGLGKDIKGEGMIGLTRGFMYAGAARVVASLWRVDDYATSVLMQKFYRGMLQEQLSAAAALRKAQFEMWRQKQWQSPFYWGGFVLQGEWR